MIESFVFQSAAWYIVIVCRHTIHNICIYLKSYTNVEERIPILFQPPACGVFGGWWWLHKEAVQHPCHSWLIYGLYTRQYILKGEMEAGGEGGWVVEGKVKEGGLWRGRWRVEGLWSTSQPLFIARPALCIASPFLLILIAVEYAPFISQLILPE